MIHYVLHMACSLGILSDRAITQGDYTWIIPGVSLLFFRKKPAGLSGGLPVPSP